MCVWVGGRVFLFLLVVIVYQRWVIDDVVTLIVTSFDVWLTGR